MDAAAATMSNEWMPSKVLLSQELPAMVNAPFASVTQENYFKGSALRLDAKKNKEEKEKAVSYNTINLTENKSAVTPNTLFCRNTIMRINHRAQIDVIDMHDEESKIYKHILVYEEQYSKFVVLEALTNTDPSEVAKKLVDIVTMIGAPRIIQSGNGRKYAEQVVREIRILLRDFCVVHGDAPKNGQMRRDFKSIIKLWMEKNPGRSWHEGLKTVQVYENTTMNSWDDKVPSQLYFGRNICEDLRRTIGAKSCVGNITVEEDSVSTCSKEKKSVSNDSSTVSNHHEIKEIELKEESDKKWSIDNEKGKTFNFVSVKNELPMETTINSDEEKAVDSEKYNFRCKICQKQYMKLGHLRNHMKTHTRIGNFECTICYRSFRLSSIYERHIQKFHGEEKKNVDINCERLKETRDNNGKNERDSENNSEKNRTMEGKSNENQITKYEKTPSLPFLRSSKKSSRRSNFVSPKKHKNATGKLNGNMLLECTYCKQKFNFPSVLKRHMRSHTNERPYVCQICSKSFKQLGHLSQHSLTHTDYRSFQCTICAIKFESLDSLKIHSQSHKDEAVYRPKEIYRLFECDNCKKVFTTKSVLERHIFTHTHERQFGCKICGKRFKQAGHVKSHMLVHTGERKFECTVCSKRFSLSNSLKKHMYVHNGEKPYQCDVCGARFLEKRNLNGHLMTHTNERPFSCKICGKRYTLADTLRRHISAAHEDGRTYQCEICAKMFKQLAHLSVHKKVHNDERPFQCHLCDKNFKHKNVLKSHLAIHANVRPFECDVCKATFVRKTNLQTHIASAHMNERPHICTICNKRFKQISHLNGHIVVHSNSMPYQCDFCDRRCNRRDNLKKHMRLHTKNKE